MTVYYAYVDTDSGGTPSNATPDNTTNSKYFTTDVGYGALSAGAMWGTLAGIMADATMRGITVDLYIYCRGATADTAVVSTSAMTCANMTVKGNLAGPSWDTSKYRLVYTGATATTLNFAGASITGGITIDGLQVEANGTATSPVVCEMIVPANSITNTVKNCYLRAGSTLESNSTSTVIGLSMRGAGTGLTCIVENTIINTIRTSGTGSVWGLRFNTTNAATCRIYNSVIEDVATGGTIARGVGANAADTVTAKNCAIFNTLDDFNTIDTVDYCASDDGDGTNAQTSVTWTNEFVDYANGNFTLKAGGTQLQGTGVGPTTDANVPTPDIAGNTRSGTTADIGAAEYSASATLTDVDTDENIYTGQTSIAYTGTGLTTADEMAIQTGTKEASGTSFSATNDTSGTFTAPSFSAVRTGGVKFGAATFSIQAATVELATLAGTLSIESGWTIHNVTDISQAADTGCIYYSQSPAVATSDQIAYESATSTYAWSVTLDSQGFITIDSSGDNRTDTFDYYIWDATDETWGTVGTWEVTATPVLTGATGAGLTGTTAEVSVNSSQLEGTVWVVCTTSSTTPSHSQIKAAQDHTGAAATYSSSDSSVTATVTFTATGLSLGQTYYAHFTQENAAATPLAATPVSSSSWTQSIPPETATAIRVRRNIRPRISTGV